MTRKEQIKQAATAEYSNDPSMTRELVCGAFELGATWADRTMIDKACTWLKFNLADYDIDQIVECEYINDFRKAMEQ